MKPKKPSLKPSKRSMVTAVAKVAEPVPVCGSAAPRPVTLSRIMRGLNSWREYYNPLVGLTMSKARTLIESYTTGMFADLMWTFGAPFTGIECADADLLSLIELRSAAVLEFDWQVKTKDPEVKGFDEVLAQEQEAALKAYYDDIDNLNETIEHLCLATFRGFAHAEKYRDLSGNVRRFEIVDQWNVVRDGTRGRWKYNPDARQVYFSALGDQMLINPSDFIIREVTRPVGRIALVKFIRENLSQKDWDAFIEIYGVPGGVVTMPPNVPTDKEREYESAAADIAKGGSGALPNGATYTANDGPRGVNPFRDHLRYLSEKLILAGTGGKLTMLAESGSGTLAGSAHAETFSRLGKKEARTISEIFQRQLDKEFLSRHFPFQPKLVYWALGQNDETDGGEVVKDVATLGNAGYQVDSAQIEEKTGYKVTLRPQTPGQPGQPGQFGPLLNRAKDKAAKLRRSVAEDPQLGKYMAKARLALAEATAEDLAPLRTALEEVLKADDADLPERLKAFEAELEEIAQQVIPANAASQKLYEILSTPLAQGLTK